MCKIKEERNEKRFIHHNHYFISWLEVVKNVTVEQTENKKGFFIVGLTMKEYNAYKIEYKTHKEVLRKINISVNRLKKVYTQK